MIAQLYPRSTEHLMSNIHLHNTIQHAFAALMQVQTSHLCMMILSRKSCTHHHHHQRRRQWIIFAVPTETKLGSTTFRFGSEHERKMSSMEGSMQHMEGVYASYGEGLCIIWGGSMYHTEGSMHHMGSMHHIYNRISRRNHQIRIKWSQHEPIFERRECTVIMIRKATMPIIAP